MKKLLILSVFAAVAFAGCKKKEATISTLQSYSAPTILLTNGDVFSMPVGGVLPLIIATAHDSFYHEDCTVLFDQSKLDNTVPGGYTVTATARNKYGMSASKTIYVAVTDISPAINLAGKYLRIETDDTVNVSMIANGFYSIDDAAANGAGDTTHVIAAWFVQTSDVALVMPKQMSKFGDLYGTGGTVMMAPGDTTIQYTLQNNAFAPTTRMFKKLQ
jgi:hypothetical protein